MSSYIKQINKTFLSFARTSPNHKFFIDSNVYSVGDNNYKLYDFSQHIIGLFSKGFPKKDYLIITHSDRTNKNVADFFNKQAGLFSGVMTSNIKEKNSSFVAFVYDSKLKKFVLGGILTYSFISKDNPRAYFDYTGGLPNYFNTKQGFSLDIAVVDKSQRGKGIAKLLISAAIAEAKKSIPSDYATTSQLQDKKTLDMMEKVGMGVATYKDNGKPVGVLENVKDLKILKTKWNKTNDKKAKVQKLFQ